MSEDKERDKDSAAYLLLEMTQEEFEERMAQHETSPCVINRIKELK